MPPLLFANKDKKHPGTLLEAGIALGFNSLAQGYVTQWFCS
jgi:hypothetical protein